MTTTELKTPSQNGFDVAWAEKALATARQTGNLHSQGNALGNLGLAYRDLGQLNQAKSYLEQALPIFEKIRSPSTKMIREWLDELEQI